MKVLLIIGGQSTENEVSRMSATNIYKNINKNHEVSVVGINKEGVWYKLTTDDFISDNWLNGAKKITDVFSFLKKFDVAFPVLHGKWGEDGTIQGLLELNNVPYVGMKVLGSAIGLDKVYTKIVLQNYDIKMVPYLYVRKKSDESFVIINDNFEEEADILNKVNEKLTYPVFVKAANGGSSVGCFKVNNENDLMEKIKEASVYDEKILIEQAINARELEVAILGTEDIIVSKVGEVLPHGEFYTYDSKYNDKSSNVQIPAKISAEDMAYIRRTAKKIFKILDGHGLSRCDFFKDKDTGEIYFNEINTMPGFTDISMYPMLINETGIDSATLIDKLLLLALK